MFESKYTIALATSICFLAIKFIEMKFILKEIKPLKFLFRDSLAVYFSVLSGIFVLEQFAPLTSGGSRAPLVFTNDPEF